MSPKVADRFTRSGKSAHGLRHASRSQLVVTVAAASASVLATLVPARSSPSETLVPLLQQAIPTLPGKALTAIAVVFPPGAASVPHRHGDAFLYAYVLEGGVRSQIEGQPAHVYRTGESWTEKPGDHHVLTENASSTETARLLVVFVADTGAPLKTDDPRREP